MYRFHNITGTKKLIPILLIFFRTKGIMGKEVTPYILQRVNEITEGVSLTASILDLYQKYR
jgi:pseudouridine-5'-phosphate glycosidase